jgi:short-chain fatty acids transporter
MITRLGELLTEQFRKFMPDAFVFTLALTLVTGFGAVSWARASLLETIQAWYQGFWMLLEFGMQVVLILVTGYSIALSSFAQASIHKLTRYIHHPRQVYPFVFLIGTILTLVSWGWMVITAVLARELALRIKGINYPYLIACVYFSGSVWVAGLSSSIPLLLNTERNYLIDAGILSSTIPTTNTLGSYLNIAVITTFLLVGPLLCKLLIPRKVQDLDEMLASGNQELPSIGEEAHQMMLPYNTVSDTLNNSPVLPYSIGIMGLVYIAFHIGTEGLDLNLNIMIFVFIILGLFLHKTPVRYGIAMKRSSSNISGVLFQFPFYAGIMGIMIHTGLGEELAQWMSSVGTIHTYPIFAYLTGAIVNFAIPSAGGEFAVIGPSIIQAVKDIGVGYTDSELIKMISKASLSVAYGESLTNALQPFYLLIILPIMGIGIKIQARDVMGYLIIPFLTLFILILVLIVWIPL